MRNDILVTGTLGAIGIACITGMIFSIIKKNKVDLIAEKLDTTVDELARNTTVDISEKIINETVEKVVTREASNKIKTACDVAVAGVRSDIRKDVSTAVNSAYENVEKDVKKELETQIGRVNIEKIKKEIVEQAKKEAMEKFRDEMDDILDKHNEELASVTKIYKSIVSTLQSTPTTLGGARILI